MFMQNREEEKFAWLVKSGFLERSTCKNGYYNFEKLIGQFFKMAIAIFLKRDLDGFFHSVSSQKSFISILQKDSFTGTVGYGRGKV